MKKKRISAFFLTIALLSGSLSSTAYAATWYMEDGDVIVSASESGQTVSQNNNTIGDNDPTFTNRDSSVASDSTITIKTSDDATANITIEDINLKHSQESAIDVKDDSKANITVRGTNTIDRRDESSPSMIHVSDGDLTLRGDGSLTLSGRTDGAKIGSNGHSGDTGQGGALPDSTEHFNGGKLYSLAPIQRWNSASKLGLEVLHATPSVKYLSSSVRFSSSVRSR